MRKIVLKEGVLNDDELFIVEEGYRFKGGYIAIHLMNALSTGGFQLQTSDRAKGQFAFTYTAHYSMSAQDTVPFEVYIKAGEAESE